MRRTLLSLLSLLSLLCVVPGAGLAQNGATRPADLIRNALSAAPASVAEHAGVVSFDGTILREGSNGWVCMPDMPDVPNNSPMCLDANWGEVIDAWMNKRDPDFQGIGISYMLQGDMPVSNVDPFATGSAEGNEWLQDGTPHIMVVVSDQSLLKDISTDPHNGGPWVMWRGTPYAHIMIPTVPRPQ